MAPIDGERFKAEIEERNRDLKSSLRSRLDNDASPLIYAIQYPLQTLKLVMRQQMVGTKVLIWYLCYSLILIHLFIKSAITFLVGSNQEMMAYLNSIYYPSIAGFSTKPNHQINNMFLCLTTLYLCVRFRNIYRVLKASIYNADYYTDLSVSSLNLAYLESFYLTFSEYVQIWRLANKHKQLINSTSYEYQKHLKFKYDTQDKLSEHLKQDLMFAFNMIDFDHCFSNSILSDTNRRKEQCKRWHLMEPIDRLAPADLQIILFIGASGSLGIFSIAPILAFASAYFDLSSEYPRDYWPSLMELICLIPKRWSNVSNVLRLFEVIILLYLNIPQIYDSSQVIMDVIVITSRANRLIETLSYDLKTYLSQTQLQFNYEKSSRNRRYFSSTFIHLQQIDDSQEERMRILNAGIRDKVGRVRLLYLEFLNIKKNHEMLLNLGVLFYGICMSYTVSLLLTHDKTRLEYFMIFLTLSSCLLPTILNLGVCARMESSVSFR